MELGGNLSEKAREDLALVELALDGDQKAYAKLMGKYRDTIYFMLLKMVRNKNDAEDLTIEAFGKAFKRLKQYTPTFAFSTWLFKIATNNCIDFIRKQKMKMTSIDETFENQDGESVSMDLKAELKDPEEKFIYEQRKKLMRDVVDNLKPRYKRLVELRYFEEYSYDEIAAEMDLPLGTVKAQLHRAREVLFNVMKSKKEKF
jgi:RNA polymerase sigma factor (sigma-70 family)